MQIIYRHIWPSSNYGLQYGGPYAWSRSKAPSKPKNQQQFNGDSDKRQITPAFTPVVSEPAGVPPIRYHSHVTVNISLLSI